MTINDKVMIKVLDASMVIRYDIAATRRGKLLPYQIFLKLALSPMGIRNTNPTT